MGMHTKTLSFYVKREILGTDQKGRHDEAKSKTAFFFKECCCSCCC